MNQRVIVITILALFTTCFVGSGAIITLKVIGGVVNSAKVDRPSRGYVPEDEDPPQRRGVPDEPDGPDEPDEPISSVVPVLPEPEPEDEVVPTPEPQGLPFKPPAIATAQFAVFHQEKAKVAPLAALQKAVKGTSVKVFQDDAPESALPPYLELEDLSTEEYDVIAGPALANARGLSEAAKKALPRAKRASVVYVYMPLGGQSLLEVSKVMLAYARTTGGVLWDEETSEYFSADAWKSRRVDSWDKGVPNLSLNVRLYEDEGDEEAWVNLRTGGMQHLGLPELVLEGVSKEVKDDATLMLLATAQTLAEQEGPVKEGPIEVSIPTMKHATFRKQLEGRAAKNAERAVDLQLVGGDSSRLPTLEILVPAGGDASQRLKAAIETIFGFRD